MLLAVGGIVACGPAETDPGIASPLTFLGDVIINPVPAVSGDPEIGGLSSLYHVGDSVYYAISDDRGRTGRPARFYVLDIHVADRDTVGGGDSGRSGTVEGNPGEGTAAGGGSNRVTASVLGWEEIFAASGEPLEPLTYDLEGMVVLDANFFISSEGDVARGVEPFVAVFGPDRAMMETLALPPGYVPNADRSSGVRDNLAFEALGITPDARYLFAATESALEQDGAVATPDAGTMARILRFDRDHGVFDAQFAYPIDAVHDSSPSPIGLEVNGVAELIALSGDHLLVLERSFVAGVIRFHSIKLFDVCLADATDVSGMGSLTDAEFVPASKRFIADLADLVPHLDNVEGMSFGPSLPSGERTLIFVSDNNFAPERQITQVLAFSVDPNALQGCSSR